MSVELYLARRYLLDRRHGTWGFLISWMATGSVAIGVGALIATLAVMTGFRNDIQDKLLGIQPHMIITPPFAQTIPDIKPIEQQLAQEKSVLAWSPFISGQVLIGRGGQSSGVVLKGIDPARETKVVNLENKLTQGMWEDLNQDPGERPSIVLGLELARNLGARVGDEVWAMTPGAEGLSPLTMPRATLFKVSGLVKTGLYDYDSSLAYLQLEEAKKIFQLNGINGIGIRVVDPFKSPELARVLQNKFEGVYWVRSWLSLNQNLFSALKLEKIVMFIILTLVTIVASFMIVSNLLLIITQKVKEIGILRAMGATAGTIRRTFLLQGLLMGAVGNAIGVVLGIAISLFLGHTNLIQLPADVYYIDKLPVRLDPVDILMVVAAASLIVLLATLYPAQRAAKLDPLDAIRYG
jgi:lipoprotein-releasing system permease protein